MIEINLIPDVKQELLRAESTRTKVISVSIVTSIAAVGLVVVLVLYVFGAQTLRGALLDSSITSEYDKLSKVDDLSKILTIQNQLTKISELSQTENVDSRLFNALLAVVPTGDNAATMSQTTIDAEAGTIRLEGQTRGYDSMEVFKKTLQNAVIKFKDSTSTDEQEAALASDISISDVSYGLNADNQKVLRFVLTFTYAKQLFSPLSKDINYKLKVDGNVTDSYLGVPRTIFAEKAKDAS